VAQKERVDVKNVKNWQKHTTPSNNSVSMSTLPVKFPRSSNSQ